MEFHPTLNMLICMGLSRPANPPIWLAGFGAQQGGGFAPGAFTGRDDLVALAAVKARTLGGRGEGWVCWGGGRGEARGAARHSPPPARAASRFSPSPPPTHPPLRPPPPPPTHPFHPRRQCQTPQASSPLRLCRLGGRPSTSCAFGMWGRGGHSTTCSLRRWGACACACVGWEGGRAVCTCARARACLPACLPACLASVCAGREALPCPCSPGAALAAAAGADSAPCPAPPTPPGPPHPPFPSLAPPPALQSFSGHTDIATALTRLGEVHSFASGASGGAEGSPLAPA